MTHIFFKYLERIAEIGRLNSERFKELDIQQKEFVCFMVNTSTRVLDFESEATADMLADDWNKMIDKHVTEFENYVASRTT